VVSFAGMPDQAIMGIDISVAIFSCANRLFRIAIASALTNSIFFIIINPNFNII
jgi:hypothetical protein